MSQEKSISGNITGFVDGQYLLLGNSEIGKLVDSTKIVNSKFFFKNPITKNIPIKLYIAAREDKKIYNQEFVSANDNIIITGDKHDFRYDLKIEGSKSENDNISYRQNLKPTSDRINKIVSYFQGNYKNPEFYKKIVKDSSKVLKVSYLKLDELKIKSIKTNPNSYTALNDIFYLKEKFSKKELKVLYNKCDSINKQTFYGKFLSNYINTNERIKVGRQFIDFEAKEINGKNHKLSDFLGKYILLEFTETGCQWCIKSIPELVKLKQKHVDKLEIISFYADGTATTREKDLKKYNIDWLTLSDGNGRSGQTLLNYNTYGYPNFYLIDPKGKVVKHVDGYDDELESEISNIILKNKIN